jgi:predicted secreted protein
LDRYAEGKYKLSYFIEIRRLINMKTHESYNCPLAPENPAPNENKCKVIVIGHCLLNPLVRIKGAKPAPPLDVKSANIIQLPCPEAMFFGMRRREITRDQLDHPSYRRFCQKLFTPYADLLEDLSSRGTKIKIIGVTNSPSCGVEKTSVGGEPGIVKEFQHSHAPGPGVFMEEIIKELKKREVKFDIEDAGK